MSNRDLLDELDFSAAGEELLALLLAEQGVDIPQENAIAMRSLCAIAPRQQTEDPPLSFAQERLWFLEHLMSGTSVYNIPTAFRLTGSLNVAALLASINEIVQRHESLRSKFPSKDGQPLQIISPTLTFTLPIINLEMLADECNIKAEELIAQEAQQPFDLAQGLLWRAKLLRLAPQEHILIVTMHHIICDAWSFGVFFDELTALYEAFSTNKPSPLPALNIQYADFAHWQRQWLQGEVLSSQLAYWKQQLDGNIPTLELPIDKPRPAIQTYLGARQFLVLPKNLTEALKALSRQAESSLFMTLLAAFKTLLYQYTQQEDIIVCSPVACRNRVEIEGLIGYFNNVLLMRTDLSGNPSFLELVERVRQVALGAYNHPDLPLEKLADFPNLVRTPLSRAMFVLQETPKPSLEQLGINVSPLYAHNGTANFDLALYMVDQGETLMAVLEYKTDLFNPASITRILEHFYSLLENLGANPEQHLSSLPVLRSTELLSTSDQVKQSEAETFVAPRDELERQLATIWEKVLGIQSIGVKNNFFELGGNSLLAVRLFAEIKVAFNKDLPLAALFQAPTIELLSSIIRQEKWSADWFSLVPIQPQGSKPPLFGIHVLGKGLKLYRPLANQLGLDQPIYGLRYGLAVEVIDKNKVGKIQITELATHYIEEIRRLQPEGPYFLAGISFGGMVAFEMAQQLVAQGQKVALLVLFDTTGPGGIKLLPMNQQVSGRFRIMLRIGAGYPIFLLKRIKKKIEKFTKKLTKRLQGKQPTYDKKYVPQVYSGKITLFRAMDRVVPKHAVLDPQLGWNKVAAGGLEIHEISGDHLEILKEPQVQVLAEKLRICLHKAQSSGDSDLAHS